jgi:uncharacterized membrane protein YccC
MSERELFRRVALHFVMGATLGALLVVALLALNIHSISDVVLGGTNPIAATAILVTGASMYFAFGAAITGFHFVIMDDDHPRGAGRR